MIKKEPPYGVAFLFDCPISADIGQYLNYWALVLKIERIFCIL
jgi:hypothetical protein